MDEQFTIKRHKKQTKWVNDMYHLILCDDDADTLERIKEQTTYILSNMQIKFKIFAFTAFEDISEYIMKQCDIAILDIDFSKRQYCGIDIAKKLREIKKDAVIIFATNFIEYAPEGYEVRAFRYVMKKDIREKLLGYLNEAVSLLKNEGETVKLQNNGEIVSYALKDILYIESNQHTVYVHLVPPKGQKEKCYQFYASIGKLERELTPKGFLRVHKSFLVNVMHIQKYQCQSVLLDNGTVLNASPARYSGQKEQYLFWKGKILND